MPGDHTRGEEERYLALLQRMDRRTAELEAANRELEAFAYSVSHDLRAPLRALDGLSLALLEDHAESLDDVGKEYLHRIRGASQQMGNLIDDMLKLSRINRGEVQSEAVDLAELARASLEQLRALDPERRVELVSPPSLEFRGDTRLMRIAMDNLIGNAWKFTRPRELAVIEVGGIEKNKELVYYVRDNGVGFEMKYSGRLFAAFQRLHPAAEFEGTGIGLATVQRVVARHGGRIWAESLPDRGTTFYFTLRNEAS